MHHVTDYQRTPISQRDIRQRMEELFPRSYTSYWDRDEGHRYDRVGKPHTPEVFFPPEGFLVERLDRHGKKDKINWLGEWILEHGRLPVKSKWKVVKAEPGKVVLRARDGELKFSEVMEDSSDPLLQAHLLKGVYPRCAGMGVMVHSQKRARNMYRRREKFDPGILPLEYLQGIYINYFINVVLTGGKLRSTITPHKLFRGAVSPYFNLRPYSLNPIRLTRDLWLQAEPKHEEGVILWGKK